ncbi:MAG: protein TolQ [Thiobacillaceae bacterium]|jgi:biopolymer transport protein TolQ|nr:protein TolQ [Thiobacillaceae bacterium]
MNLSLDQDLSLLTLVMSASWVVKVVLILLILASVASWWMIFVKFYVLRREHRRTESFEQEFWDTNDTHSLFKKISEQKDKSGIEEIFRLGYMAYANLISQPGANPNNVMDSTRRTMRAAYQRELDALETSLPFLATVGSVSPYIGLFGTVWGIMNAFRGLSNVAQATLAHVAPGIAEALIATAIGLFAAIPAVIAYNRFSHDIDRLANRLDVFMEEYSIFLQRQAMRS